MDREVSVDEQVRLLVDENDRLKKQLHEAREFLSIAPGFCGVVSLQGEVVKCNDRALKIIETPFDKIKGRLFWECPWWQPLPESAKRVEAAVRAASRGIPSTFDIEYWASVNGVGEIRWVALAVEPFKSKDGKFYSITATGIDINENKMAQDALYESQLQLTRAIAVSRIGFYDWDIGQNKIKYSRQMLQDWGIDPRADVSEYTFEDAVGRIHPDDRQALKDDVERTIKNHTPFKTEYRVIRRDGKIIWIEAQGQVSYDSSGRPTRFFGTSIDISERKKAETDLHRTSVILNSIVNSTTDTIYLKDRKSRMIFANPETLKNIGASEEDVYGKNDLEFLGPESGAEEILQADERIMSSGQGEMVEESVTWAGGNRRIYMSSKQPHRDAAGKIIGLVGISRDITELKKTQSDLEEALRVRDTFLSIASHELKTPLTSLKLQSQMSRRLLQKYGPNAFTMERIEKLIENSNVQADRLARLVDDMLDISRISSGKLSMNFEKVDLSSLVADILNRFFPQLDEAEIKVVKECDADIVAEIDPFRFEQVLANLISNAIKYAPGSEINVKLENDRDWAILRFRDQGPGIPLDKQEAIFERFERAANPSQVSGLGLGLNISREIVRAHGGDISVKSQINDGSEFIVKIPLEQKH